MIREAFWVTSMGKLGRINVCSNHREWNANQILGSNQKSGCMQHTISVQKDP